MQQKACKNNGNHKKGRNPRNSQIVERFEGVSEFVDVVKQAQIAKHREIPDPCEGKSDVEDHNALQ